MQSELHRVVMDVFEGRAANSANVEAAITAIMTGQASEVEIASFLTALRGQPETAAQLVGAARAMRSMATPIPCKMAPLLDTCGTGGDSLHTFNISTATAIVLAGCGIHVAKHGNRSVSSSSGSADVLEALGINVNLPPDRVAESVDTIGIGFCFAPLLHGAMKYAAPVRKQLGFRTLFNLLGPLTNPANAEFQLVGTSQPQTARNMAEALCELGTHRAVVVCGGGQLDEVALWGETVAYEVESATVKPHVWTAATFGLPECQVLDLQVHGPADSAGVIERIFRKVSGPARNIVLANAAAGLWIHGRCESLRDGVSIAAQAVDSGAAAAKLDDLRRFSNS